MNGKMHINLCMIPITKISGRLGNQMFLLASLYAITRDCKFPIVDDALGYYFQDPSHFKGYEKEIKILFGSNIPEKTEKIAIHVRRTDYVENSFYVNLPTSYYKEAMDQFPDSQFLVFSDDIEWCKNQEIFKDCAFAEGNELDDMNRMASCSGIIIANSSFSWWAAYISPYAEKVVAPNSWYSDGIERTYCPIEWVRI